MTFQNAVRRAREAGMRLERSHTEANMYSVRALAWSLADARVYYTDCLEDAAETAVAMSKAELLEV